MMGDKSSESGGQLTQPVFLRFDDTVRSIEWTFLSQDGPGDAGEPVCKRHDYDITVLTQRKQAPQPLPESAVPLTECVHGCSRL